MTRKDEGYLFDSLDQIRAETHENNLMLKAIVRYLANEAANADNENTYDFGRNVLANLLSEFINGRKRLL